MSVTADSGTGPIPMRSGESVGLRDDVPGDQSSVRAHASEKR